MSIPLIQQYRIGKYLIRQKLSGRKRYPLVLMLEPLFQCNLACAGCGKIDYEKDILQRRMSVADALQAVDDCGAPVVSIPGGEPLIHKELPQIVEGIVARRKFVYLCTNALLVPKHIDEYQPSPYLTFSIHLDGLQRQHDASVCQEGVFDKAVAAIRLLRERKFRVTINCTLFAKENPDEVAEFFDFAMGLGVEAITVSPGYHYEHAPRHDVFLGRIESKTLFREMLGLHFSSRRPEVLPGSDKWTEYPVMTVVVEVVERARERGEVHPDASALPTAQLFMMGLYAMLIASHEYSRAARAEILDNFMATVLRGVAPR